MNLGESPTNGLSSSINFLNLRLVFSQHSHTFRPLSCVLLAVSQVKPRNSKAVQHPQNVDDEADEKKKILLF